MKHRVKIKKFGRHAESRKALIKGLALALFTHGKIETTLPKAKYLRPYVEKIITRAKDASLHNRRILISTLQDKEIVSKLFDEIAPQFKTRNGGYTSIRRTRVREGDVATMAVISFVEDKNEVKGEVVKPTTDESKKVVKKEKASKEAVKPKIEAKKKTVTKSKKVSEPKEK